MAQKLNDNSIKKKSLLLPGNLDVVAVGQLKWKSLRSCFAEVQSKKDGCVIIHFLPLPCQFPAPKIEDHCRAGVGITAQEKVSGSTDSPEDISW